MLRAVKLFKFQSQTGLSVFNSGKAKKRFCEDYSQVKNISEFREGVTFLNEGKFDQAEAQLKECLKIFKNVNQTETMAYLFVLKKYTQSLFYSKKLSQCEAALKASIEVSKGVFKERPEMTFPAYRNLLAFYTYTDIQKSSELVDSYMKNDDASLAKHKKFFCFAGGAIKLLNNEYNSARDYMNTAMGFSDLPVEFQAYNMHNLALLNAEMKRDLDMAEGEDAKTKWRRDFNFPDSQIAERESLVLYKQTLAKLELESNIPRDARELEVLKSFLYSQSEVPEKEEEEIILTNSFKHLSAGLTITNLAEMMFEKGKDKDRQTAFWLKTGIKHYESYEKENIARHLTIFALFYSQLGQTLFAEGLYRKAIELLKNVL